MGKIPKHVTVLIGIVFKVFPPDKVVGRLLLSEGRCHSIRVCSAQPGFSLASGDPQKTETGSGFDRSIICKGQPPSASLQLQSLKYVHPPRSGWKRRPDALAWLK